MRTVDLDAIEAEATGDPIEITLGGVKWRAHASLPWEAIVAYKNDDISRLFECILEPGQDVQAFERAFLADKPSHDLATKRIRAIYAAQDLGEASPS